MEELPEQRKVLFIVSVYKRDVKTDCTNHQGISLLSTAYKIFSNIVLSMLTPHAEEIIGDNQCGLRCDRSTADHIFCIKYLRKNWEYKEPVHQLLIEFKKSTIHLQGRYCVIFSFSKANKNASKCNLQQSLGGQTFV